jgi:hypothetical protein
VQRISRLPNVRLCPKQDRKSSGLVSQLRAAFAAAAESQPDYVVYTEPDKQSFFRTGLRLLLAAAQTSSERRPGIVLAARTAREFATFPEGQRAAESIMNQLCSEAFGIEGDYTYGPMLIHRHLLRFFQLIPDDSGWGWRFFIMATAHQLGLDIQLCPVAAQCPRVQRQEDDGASRSYRLRQLVQNITGLGNGWIGLLHQPMMEPVLANQ